MSSPPSGDSPSTKKQKERTIQVKIGNQAARAMTPDQAADYLKSIAGKGWGSGRELKMTFDNGSTSTVALPRTRGTAVTTMDSDPLATSSMIGSVSNRYAAPMATTSRADGMPCSEKEMKALMSMFVEIMGLQMNTERLNSTSKAQSPKQTATKKFTFPADLPPPPGGWPEDLMWPTEQQSADSMPELEDIPNEDRIKMILVAKENLIKKQQLTAAVRPNAASHQHKQQQQPIPPVPGSKQSNKEPPKVTGVAGIAPFEWSALERAAIEDALEQEERIRKDSSANSKKNKTKQQKNKTNISNAEEAAAAALKKVQEANKKLSKAVVAWRNRVASATLQNEVAQLELLLAESPLADLSNKNNNPHLEFLEQTVVLKNWKQVQTNAEARIMLARHLLCGAFSPNLMFNNFHSSGRSALHASCLYGDHGMVKLIVELSAAKLSGNAAILESQLQKQCQDSGWGPLMYATLSGSMRTVEALFSVCCSPPESSSSSIPAVLCKALTNEMQTWKKGGANRGVSARQLAEAVLSGKPDKYIETHGMALQEILLHFQVKNGAPSLYLAELKCIAKRLQEIETSGLYTPMNEKELARMDIELAKEVEEQLEKRATSTALSVSASVTSAEQLQRDESTGTEAESEDEIVPTASSKKSKLKKKNKGGSSGMSKDCKPAAADVTAASSSSVSDSASKQQQQPRAEDPLVTALKGMGFEESQIMEAVKACGGISRATADDVVARIFGGGEAPGDAVPAAADEPPAVVMEPNALPTVSMRADEERRKKEEERLVAEQLAAKREEQRRRNREWNNRAQQRQRQEAQEKLAKAAELKARTEAVSRLRSGLAPASNFFPTCNSTGIMQLQQRSSASPTIGASSTIALCGSALKPSPDALRQPPNAGSAIRQMGGLYLGGAVDDNNYSNEDTTVASSSEIHGTIEVGGNDDATVSTMGSYPAVPPPIPPSLFAPPGFSGGGQGQAPAAASGGWEAHRSVSMGDNAYGSGSFGQLGGMGPPLGIPESRPLLDHDHGGHAARSHSFGGPPHSNGLHLMVQGGGRAFQSGGQGGMGGSSLLGSFSGHDESQHSTGMGSSLLSGTLPTGLPPRSGAMERSSTAPAVPPSMQNDPMVPGLFLGFGSVDRNMCQSSGLESSIIDSISTSNNGISSPSLLWGDPPAPTAGGSSLLGNIIDNNSSSEYQLSGTPHNPSLFSQSSFSSDQNNNNAAPGSNWGTINHSNNNGLHSSGGGGSSRGGGIW